MLKFIKIFTFFLITFLSLQISAMKVIRLSPHETKSLTNNGLWTVKANCTVQANAQDRGRIRIRVLKNHGTVNGKTLSTGQATSLTVKNNSNIAVSADVGTEINLSNVGAVGLAAYCSV